MSPILFTTAVISFIIMIKYITIHCIQWWTLAIPISWIEMFCPTIKWRNKLFVQYLDKDWSASTNGKEKYLEYANALNYSTTV